MPTKAPPRTGIVEDNFGVIWPVHVAAFSNLLIRLRARFDGDLDLLLVLTAIAERTRRETWTPELRTYRDLIPGAGDEPPQTPINIQSVSDYTRIPRETVRRKVNTLVAKGWVVRRADGSLGVQKQAAQDLEGATGDTVAYLTALLQAFDTLPRGKP